jgi:cell division protein FtsL
MNKAIIFILSVVIVVVSFFMIVAVHIPNIMEANEEVRLAEQAVEESEAELEQAMNEVNSQIDEIERLCATGEIQGC